MKTSEINIRDPYVLLSGGKYYLYGTRSETCWGPAEGFDCYISPDLREWEGPVEIFSRPEGFFADRFYWAPECYEIAGDYYLITTLGSADRKKAIYALKSSRPEGPFTFYSGPLTPPDWTSIDGTLYQEDGGWYLIFSHSLEDAPDGDFCRVKLSDDLSHPVGEVETFLKAKDAPWSLPVPFAGEEFGIEGDGYFSDGPGLLKLSDGRLYMILSSWSTSGYAVGVAVSDHGSLQGPWRMQEKPLYPVNGGHGMFFRTKEGELLFALHYPNDKYAERPHFFRIECRDGQLTLGEEWT